MYGKDKVHKFESTPSNTTLAEQNIYFAFLLQLIIIIIIIIINIFENDIKELDPRKAYKYLGIEESFDIQHKNEKEKL